MKVLTMKVLFVEDKHDVQVAIDGFMKEYSYDREFAIDFDEFKIKFSSYNPDIVVVDYDLKNGHFYNEIFSIVNAKSKIDNRIIGLIGVTAVDPFADIKKTFLKAGFDNAYYNDDTEALVLDLVSEFAKIQEKINN